MADNRDEWILQTVEDCENYINEVGFLHCSLRRNFPEARYRSAQSRGYGGQETRRPIPGFGENRSQTRERSPMASSFTAVPVSYPESGFRIWPTTGVQVMIMTPGGMKGWRPIGAGRSCLCLWRKTQTRNCFPLRSNEWPVLEKKGKRTSKAP